MIRAPPSERLSRDQGARFEVHFEKHRGFHGSDAEPFEARYESATAPRSGCERHRRCGLEAGRGRYPRRYVTFVKPPTDLGCTSPKWNVSRRRLKSRDCSMTEPLMPRGVSLSRLLGRETPRHFRRERDSRRTMTETVSLKALARLVLERDTARDGQRDTASRQVPAGAKPVRQSAPPRRGTPGSAARNARASCQSPTGEPGLEQPCATRRGRVQDLTAFSCISVSNVVASAPLATACA